VKLSVRHVIPPYIPPVQPLQTVPGYASFDKLMQEYSSTAVNSPRAVGAAPAASSAPAWDLTALPPAEDDAAAFSKWDFVSLRTLKIELGIAQELVAYDASFKVRQLLGDSSDCSPNANRGHARTGGSGSAAAAAAASGGGISPNASGSHRGSGTRKKVQKARSLNSGGFTVLGLQFKAKTGP
jgi:hypothetical protein